MTTNSMVNTEVDIDDLFDPDALNLYAVLGLDKSATSVEIRRAYRKASMAFHPDRNSDPESKKRFQTIKEAYETLSDPFLREFYDTIGYRRPTDEQLKSKGLELVNQTFTNVIDQMANETDARFVLSLQDPVDLARQVLRNSIQQIMTARTNMQTAIDRYEYMQRKFARKKKGEDFAASPLNVMITARIEDGRRRLSLGNLDLLVHEHALQLADEYAYQKEQPMQFTVTWGTATSSGFNPY